MRGGTKQMSGAIAGASKRHAPADVLAPQKAQLVTALAETMRERKLTQIQAARLCGTDQPTLSKVLNGRSDRVTIDKLMRWLAALGRPVELHLPDAAPMDLNQAEGWLALADAIPCLIWINKPDGTLLYATAASSLSTATASAATALPATRSSTRKTARSSTRCASASPRRTEISRWICASRTPSATTVGTAS
jgi:predicted XRE-type DNA-binding protein